MTDFLKAVAGLVAAVVALVTLLITLGIVKTAPTATQPPDAIGGRVLTQWMDPNDELRQGDRFVSLDGKTTLILQADGDLVLYQTPTRGRLWSAGTAGRGGDHLVMQGDGNLVLKAGGNAVWDTGTVAHPGAALTVQDDSHLVVYGPDKQKCLWASNTCG